jgi:hypothetical protein
MFEASSQGRKATNVDGSHDVRCFTCERFISTTFDKIFRAECEMCRRARVGEPITPELIKAYELSHIGKDNVSMLVLEDPPVPEMQKAFRLGTLIGSFFRAIGITKDPVPDTPSIAVAKKQRRGRLFDGIKLGEK